MKLDKCRKLIEKRRCCRVVTKMSSVINFRLFMRSARASNSATIKNQGFQEFQVERDFQEVYAFESRLQWLECFGLRVCTVYRRVQSDSMSLSDLIRSSRVIPEDVTCKRDC